MSATLAESVMPDNAAFAMRLARNIKGEVLFDRATRGRYSTDASIISSLHRRPSSAQPAASNSAR